MEAPDKIYIAKSLIKTPYGNEWSPTPYISRENTEYIRKDALLDFLNERRKVLTSGESFVAGERKMLREIIEKIELL